MYIHSAEECFLVKYILWEKDIRFKYQTTSMDWILNIRPQWWEDYIAIGY